MSAPAITIVYGHVLRDLAVAAVVFILMVLAAAAWRRWRP